MVASRRASEHTIAPDAGAPAALRRALDDSESGPTRAPRSRRRVQLPGATTAEPSSERAVVDGRGAMPRNFAIVAERHRKANVRAALRRACAGAPRGEWPIVVCKDERAAPFVAMTLDHFLAMCAEWWAWRQR